MKLPILFPLLSALLLASCASVGDKPPCCAEAPAETTSAAPLPEDSVYQLVHTWTDENGKPFPLENLRGQPAVLAFFFTRCEYACPILTHDMAALRMRLDLATAANTRFVLVSMDAERDDPASLRDYRRRQGMGEGWTLLRADEAKVRELALVLGIKYKRDNRGQFSHSNAIFVLDRDGAVTHRRDGLQVDSTATVEAVKRVAHKNGF